MALLHSVSVNPRPSNIDKESSESIIHNPCGTLGKLPQEIRDMIYENIFDESLSKTRFSDHGMLYTNKRLSAEFGKHYYESRIITVSNVRRMKDLECRTPFKARYFMDYCHRFHLTVHINGGAEPQIAAHFVKYKSSLISNLQTMMNSLRSLRELTIDLLVTCPHPGHSYYGIFEWLLPRNRNAAVQYKHLRVTLRRALGNMARQCKVLQKFMFRDLDEWIYRRDSHGRWIQSIEKGFRTKRCNRVGSCASCEGGSEIVMDRVRTGAKR
jgi:hypothetical protein